MTENNYDDKSLKVARQLIDELREQFELETSQLTQQRNEIPFEKDFEVSKFYTYSGPNYYLDTKAIVFNLYIAPAGDTVEFYKNKILTEFPQLANIETPFVVDLFAETLIQILKMDIDLFINKYRISRIRDEYVIAVEFLDEYIAEDAIYLLSDWFRAMSQDKDFDFKTDFLKLQADFDKTLFGGPTIYSLVEAGLKLKIPVVYLLEENQFMWGYGKKQLRGRSTTFHTDGIKDTEFTMYKDMVGEFLDMCGFPTPKGKNCFNEEEIVKEALSLGFPVVVKPVAGHKGQGVTTGIESEEEVRKAFKNIIKTAETEGANFEGALVQKQIYGTDHRLLAVNGKFAAALERVPAYVVGNGTDNIEKLIEIENALEIRLDNARSPLAKIKIDENLIDFLALQNLSLQSVPAMDEKIVLRRVANISAGGVSINVTDKMHPENIKLVDDIAGFFNVKCLGIDVLSQDISKSWREGNFGIIEINAGPGVFMHLAPAYGGSINIPKLIMESHFKTPDSSRIPIIASNKTTPLLVSTFYELLKLIKPNIYFGALTENGVYFNNEFFHNNPDHSQNVKLILRNPKTEVALFAHNKEDIYDFGLLHEGADIVILDNPEYAEEIVLKEQLLHDGILIDVYEHEVALVIEGIEVKALPYKSEEEKVKAIFELIGKKRIEVIFEKYQI